MNNRKLHMPIAETKYVFIGSDDKSLDLYSSFIKICFSQEAMENVQIKKMSTFGLSSRSSIVKVFPGNHIYENVTLSDVETIVKEHLKGDKPVKRLLLKNEKLNYLKLKDDEAFYHKQYRVVLKNSGIIDPECIDDYISRSGYRGLAKIMANYSGEQVVDEIKKSGIRGRGGGGFPTWMKWKFTLEAPGEEKVVICNADEGDPGAYMDRSILEGDPHAILEGMIIAAYTVKAKNGYIYCRAEYPLAIERMEKAIAKAKEYGFLGDKILGTDFSFDVEIRLGAGAFVCGEETALIASIEGQRGMPRPRPPYPAVKGLWQNPTVINNVETYANIPVIMHKGGDWYGSIGTEKSKGTKVFALTGKVQNCGLVEVPMGTTLKEMVYDVGGGLSNKNNSLKAIQTGGPSGGVIPEKFIDSEISYEALTELGSIMGSGGMIIMDNTDCMVDVAKFYLQFTVDESCGKCAPCRIGTRQMLNLLEDVTSGIAKVDTLVRIRHIAEAMSKASLCGLGQTASNPVKSTMKHFADEYKSHVYDKICPTKKCKRLVSYTIDKEKCIGCTLCAKKCPANCIAGARKEPHIIDQSKCIKCGKCEEVCKFDAVIVN